MTSSLHTRCGIVSPRDGINYYLHDLHDLASGGRQAITASNAGSMYTVTKKQMELVTKQKMQIFSK